METLKPCPFCGAEADTKTLAYGQIVTRCPSVNCIAFDDWKDVESWNSRPIEDALRAKIEAAEELIAAYKAPEIATTDTIYFYVERTSI